MLTTVIPCFQEIDRIGESPIRSSSAWGPMVVPDRSGCRRVEDHDGDARASQGQGSGRVQNPGAEGGQLGGLLVAGDAARVRAEGTIRGSAVINPSTSVQISTRSAPSAAPSSAAVKSEPPRPNVVGNPGGGGADEALRYRNASGFGQRLQLVSSPLVQHLGIRGGAAEASVGHQDRADVYPIRIETRLRPWPPPPAASSRAHPGPPWRRAPPARASGPARPRPRA